MFRIEFAGGDWVPKGTYWSVSGGDRVRLEETSTLPGPPSETYLKFHPVALIVIGPLLGLVYAVFLPFAAIAMVAWVTLEKVFGGIAQGLWKLAVFSWQPAESYLAGRQNRGWASRSHPPGEADHDQSTEEEH